MSILRVVDNAVYAKLSGGTALISELGGTAIYNLIAKDKAALPYVIFSHVTGGPENDCPSDRRTALYLVRAFASTHVKAKTIDEKVDALLHRQSLSVSGYTNWWTVREMDVPSTVEILGNSEKVFSAGGYYRIKLDA